MGRGADVNARNAAGETPLMALFLPYIDAGFRLSPALSSSASSAEVKERTMVLPLLEFLIVKGADVSVETRPRFPARSVSVDENCNDDDLDDEARRRGRDAASSSENNNNNNHLAASSQSASSTTTTARRLALHYGFARAAERLATEEKSLRRFEWLQRPVDHDPFRLSFLIALSRLASRT